LYSFVPSESIGLYLFYCKKGTFPCLALLLDGATHFFPLGWVSLLSPLFSSRMVWTEGASRGSFLFSSQPRSGSSPPSFLSMGLLSRFLFFRIRQLPPRLSCPPFSLKEVGRSFFPLSSSISFLHFLHNPLASKGVPADTDLHTLLLMNLQKKVASLPSLRPGFFWFFSENSVVSYLISL